MSSSEKDTSTFISEGIVVPRTSLQKFATSLFKLYTVVARHYIHYAPGPDGTALPQLDVVCISDTQNTQPRVADGDLLLHTGNLTQNGTRQEIQTQLNWLSSLPYEHKVIILGDRDTALFRHRSKSPDGLDDSDQEKCKMLEIGDLDLGGCIILNNSGATLNFVKGNRQISIYGIVHNMQPRRPHDDLADIFKIPAGIDILMTTIPPLNSTYDSPIVFGNKNATLAREIARVQPKIVVFRRHESSIATCHIEPLIVDHVRADYEKILCGTGGYDTLFLMWLRAVAVRPGLLKTTTMVNGTRSFSGDASGDCHQSNVVVHI